MNPPLILINSIWEPINMDSQLLQALLGLSPQAQRAINLRFWERYTIEEVSEVLRITWDEADNLIERSLKELRAQLTKAGVSSRMFNAS